MKNTFFAAALSAIVSLSLNLPAEADQPAFHISVPLQFGAGHRTAPARLSSPAEVRLERRLRLTRYGLQLIDGIVSAIGYRAYARCLSCLAFPGGGPRGSAPFSFTNLNADRPAESDPLIEPFSHGGFLSLAVGAVAYDLVDARIEKHWPIQRRITADLVEISAHAWGISTWLPELATLHHATAVAAACGAQWHAQKFGEAFSEGCVNEYYRAGSALPQGLPATGLTYVCAPPRFKRGTYLFSTSSSAIVSNGTPCPDEQPLFPNNP